jgi:hypothetical protein
MLLLILASLLIALALAGVVIALQAIWRYFLEDD